MPRNSDTDQRGSVSAGLRQAAQAYERIAGESVDPACIDPGRPGIAERYRRFLQRPFRIAMGANDGEWLAMYLGIKPMIREIIPRHRLKWLHARCRAAGWDTRELPAPGREDPHDGLFCRPPKQRPSTDGRNRLFIVYAGPDGMRLDAARELENQALYRGTQDRFANMLKMGSLLGYPDCCADTFARQHHRANPGHLKAALGRTRYAHPLLNNLSMGMFHYIGWIPCRFDCPVSLRTAARMDRFLARFRYPEQKKIRRFLAMPRLYIDDRRQILFDGRSHGDGSITYRTIYSPFTFDRCRKTGGFDWAFYARWAAVLDSGNRIRIEDSVIRVFSGRRSAGRLDAPKGTVLFPFAFQRP